MSSESDMWKKKVLGALCMWFERQGQQSENLGITILIICKVLFKVNLILVVPLPPTHSFVIYTIIQQKLSTVINNGCTQKEKLSFTSAPHSYLSTGSGEMFSF